MRYSSILDCTFTHDSRVNFIIDIVPFISDKENIKHIAPTSEESIYFAQICRCVLNVGGRISRDILMKQMPLEFLGKNVNSMNLSKKKKQLLKEATVRGNYDQCDLTLIYNVIRNYCKENIPVPTNGWGQHFGGVNVSDDIERIRILRNDVCAHITSASIKREVFEVHFQTLRDVCYRMDTMHGEFLEKSSSKSYLEQLNNEIKTSATESSELTNYILEMRMLYQQSEDINKELSAKVLHLESNVEKLICTTEDALQFQCINRRKFSFCIVV